MSSADVDVFFDYSSPFAYLGVERVVPILERTGASARWVPFLLGALFRDVGQVDVPLFSMPAAKQAHVRADLGRWSKHAGVPFAFPALFPMNTVKALRATLALPDGDRLPFARAVFRAYWGGEGADLASDAVLARIASACGHDGASLVSRVGEQKDALRANTTEAAARGAFGAPTFFVGDEMFWGQDRLVLVERALATRKPH